MFPIIDGHLDSLQALYLPGDNTRSLLTETKTGHFDLPRAQKGLFAGGLFAIFVPATPKRNEIHIAFPERGDERFKPVEGSYAEGIAKSGIDCLHQLAADSEGRLKIATTARHVRDNLNKGIISAILHFEGAEPIASDFSNLEYYYQSGLRSVGIVWSRANAFGHGVDFKFPGSPDTGPGLSDEGKELVRVCNRMGILMDLSHLNEKGFWDVHKLSAAPLVATHSCMHALTPITRNLTDRQLDAIKESNGIVGINFCTGFLRDDAKLTPDTPIEDIVKHIVYATEKMGVDHVGIGSDFDGALIPEAIGDVAGLPKLIQNLMDNGFDEASIRKIAHENWLRVFADSFKSD